MSSQRGAAGAEIKVPLVENTELKCSPFKAWSRSVDIAMHAMLTARDFFFKTFLFPILANTSFPVYDISDNNAQYKY